MFSCCRLLLRMSERASSYAHSWLSSNGVEVLLSQQLMDADWTKVQNGLRRTGWGHSYWG
jgi:NADH dehydrogenase FAD-containing subunit